MENFRNFKFLAYAKICEDVIYSFYLMAYLQIRQLLSLGNLIIKILQLIKYIFSSYGTA